MSTFTKQRDTDKYLARELNDRDLMNLCIAKPDLSICNDDQFWRRWLLTRYGPVEKSPNKSWKKFYLQLVYYLDKAGENMDKGMKLAAEAGHQDLVDYFISKGARFIDWGLFGAARGGHLDLVKYLIGKDVKPNWNALICGAAEGGHRDLIEYFIKQAGPNYPFSWRLAIHHAEIGQHPDLANYLKQKIV